MLSGCFYFISIYRPDGTKLPARGHRVGCDYKQTARVCLRSGNGDGYDQDTSSINLSDALQLTLNLRPAAQILNSVTVTTNDARTRLERAVMGVERLNIEAIKVLPVLVCFRFLRQMLFDP